MACFDDATLLKLLKQDLGLMTASKDELLVLVLGTAKKEIEREGITLQDTVDDAHLIVMYAAYLFRKRAKDTDAAGMPRMLRYALNNRLFSEKLAVPDSGTAEGGDADV